MKKITLLFVLITSIATQGFAQHIREQDIAYSRHIVREINLRSDRNKVVFGKDCIVSAILLDAVKQGAKAYSYEHPTQSITYEQIRDRLKIPASEEDSIEAWYGTEELYVVELTERFIFDKNSSEFRFIPISITLFIPAEISTKGIQEPVAVIPFEECTRIFRSDVRAYVPATKIGQPAININEQFVLRSYASNIVNIGNEDDLYFDQRYSDPYKAFMAMKAEENALQEMMYAAYHPK